MRLIRFSLISRQKGNKKWRKCLLHDNTKWHVCWIISTLTQFGGIPIQSTHTLKSVQIHHIISSSKCPKKNDDLLLRKTIKGEKKSWSHNVSVSFFPFSIFPFSFLFFLFIHPPSRSFAPNPDTQDDNIQSQKGDLDNNSRMRTISSSSTLIKANICPQNWKIISPSIIGSKFQNFPNPLVVPHPLRRQTILTLHSFASPTRIYVSSWRIPKSKKLLYIPWSSSGILFSFLL